MSDQLQNSECEKFQDEEFRPICLSGAACKIFWRYEFLLGEIFVVNTVAHTYSSTRDNQTAAPEFQVQCQ